LARCELSSHRAELISGNPAIEISRLMRLVRSHIVLALATLAVLVGLATSASASCSIGALACQCPYDRMLPMPCGMQCQATIVRPAESKPPTPLILKVSYALASPLLQGREVPPATPPPRD
jgi:hypothetical protein